MSQNSFSYMKHASEFVLFRKKEKLLHVSVKTLKELLRN